MQLFSLHQLLLSFDSFNQQDQEMQQTILNLLGDNQHCWSKTNFNPGHLTASLFLLSPDRQSVLLIFHPFMKIWVQPGGHIDLEDPHIQAAALRELSEETGIQADEIELFKPPLLDLDIHQVPSNPQRQHPAHLHFDVRFAARSKVWSTQAGYEVEDVRWVQLKEIDQIETDHSVRKAVTRLLPHTLNTET